MNTDRFIAINLTEDEWQALRAVKADPTGWLKQQVLRAIEEAGYRAADGAVRQTTPATAH
jgi:hypothetical protein